MPAPVPTFALGDTALTTGTVAAPVAPVADTATETTTDMTPHVATPQDQAAAAASNRIVTEYDNWVEMFPVEAVFIRAMADDAVSKRTGSTAVQRTAAVLMAQHHKLCMVGTEGYSHETFVTLSPSAGKGRYNAEHRSQFVQACAARFGVVKPVAMGNPGVKPDEWKNADQLYLNRMDLIRTALNYATDLCWAGGTGNEHLSPGYVLKWFDQESGCFWVAPSALLMNEQQPVGYLLTLTGDNAETRDKLIAENPDVFRMVENEPQVALTKKWFTADHLKTGPDYFQADAARVKAVAASKRFVRETTEVVNPDGTKTTTTTETPIPSASDRKTAEQKQKEADAAAAIAAADKAAHDKAIADKAKADADAKNKAGRPQGSADPGNNEPSLEASLKNIVRIMALPVERLDGHPRTHLWSNNPVAALIDLVIGDLSAYRQAERDHEEAFNRAELERIEGEKAAAKASKSRKTK
jgi:hypothetical protein